MQDFSRKNFRYGFRAVALLGLLAGLLFSSGEGIRLFPFPAFAAAQAGKSFLNKGEKNDYQENIFRFEKSESGFSKMQRTAKDHWAGIRLPQDPPVFKSAIVFPAAPDFISIIFKSKFIQQSPGSRAPPFS